MHTPVQGRQLAALLGSWGLELIQLHPVSKRANASLQSFQGQFLLRLQLCSDVVVRAMVRRQCCLLAMTTPEKNAARIMGTPLPGQRLLLGGPGCDIDLFLPHGTTLHIAILQSPALPRRRALRICGNTSELLQFIDAPASHAPASADGLMQHIGRVYESGDPLESSRAALPRVAAAISACRLIDRSIARSISMRELARHCGVAERTLEYGFRQLYDTTPLSFIRSQRLSRTRQALLNSTPTTRVSEAARALGFTHMGQFSMDYRRLFGETPSATLASGRPTDWAQRNPR